MSDLNEFAINLPMASVGGIGDAAIGAELPFDVTASVQIPPDVNVNVFDHIGVNMVTTSVVNYDPKDPNFTVDLMLTVSVTNPQTFCTKNFNMVKRLSFDKVKLAAQAENMTPVSVVEGEEDPAEVARQMNEFYAAKRAREIAGLAESAGKKKFKVMIKYDDKEVQGKPPAIASATITYDACKDAAHARHIFAARDAAKYKNPKIIRVTEVKDEIKEAKNTEAIGRLMGMGDLYEPEKHAFDPLSGRAHKKVGPKAEAVWETWKKLPGEQTYVDFLKKKHPEILASLLDAAGSQ